MRFAQRLRELREAAGLSEAKLAELSGVSFGAVHNYGLGIRQPTFAAVVKLARALNVTCEAFAGCEDVAGEEETGPDAQEPKPKGRPRKDAAAEAPPAAPKPSGEKRPRRRKGP